MKKEFSSLPSGLQDVTGPVDASTGGTTTTAKPSLKEEAKLAKVETNFKTERGGERIKHMLSIDFSFFSHNFRLLHN